MATVLDAGLLSFLMPLFVFIFVFVVLYALLTKTNMFGEKQTALNFLASICIAAVAVFAGNLVKLFGVVVPWIVFLIVILVLIFGLYKMFGVEDKEIWPTIGGHTTVYIIILIIILVGLSLTFEAEVSPFPGEEAAGESGLRNRVISTIVHPRLLGALFILIVAAFTVKLLVDKAEDK